jgi:hypothetical protein
MRLVKISKDFLKHVGPGNLREEIEQPVAMIFMSAVLNPTALPALRVVASFFLIINILAMVYIFRNRHRFFDRDPNVDNDIPPFESCGLK